MKMPETQRYPFVIKGSFYLLFAILLIYSLIGAKEFLWPIAIAALFSYLIYPLVSFFEKKLHFPRILANLLSIVLMLLGFVGGFMFLYKQIALMLTDLPAIQEQTLHNIDKLYGYIEAHFGISISEQKIWAKNMVTNTLNNGDVAFGKFFSQTTGTLVKIGLLPVFIFFMLFNRNKFKNFIMQITPRRNRIPVSNIIQDVSHITQHYMGGVLVVVLILCFLNSLGLYIIGMKYAIMLGIIAAVCNAIPYFGTILGFMFPLAFAIFTQGDPHQIVGVFVLFFIIQFIENNILTPNIVGGNVQLNAFVIILSLIVGAMVWGIPGMLVIVPFMAVLRVIFENIPSMRPYSYLLGTKGTDEHSVTLSKIKSLTKWIKNSKNKSNLKTEALESVKY
jgi:predicted PurR-regulated permease PerM